jgi:hypothetical protein
MTYWILLAAFCSAWSQLSNTIEINQVGDGPLALAFFFMLLHFCGFGWPLKSKLGPPVLI